MANLSFLALLFPLLCCCSCGGFQFPNSKTTYGSLESLTPLEPCRTITRKRFLAAFGVSFLAIAAAPSNSNAKSYSANAKNLERMNTGDMSGGSTYDNNPKSEAGKKRRAITGCKNSVAREEAAVSVLNISSLSEFDCNQKVLGGESEFMLEALRKLDCPSCPYGINTSRK